MPSAEPIDLHHQATERVIGVYLLDTSDGPALFDCGPSTCIGELKRGLAARELALTDVAHLLLSHIHLDHAGAAGSLVREHPALQVHVSPVGAPHLIDPRRLEASARRLYGETFDPLWGELAPVPEQNVHAVGDRILGLDCFPTPGHASHHVSYVGGEGTLIHFGVVDEPGDHVARMREQLDRWSERVRSGQTQDEFVEACRRDLIEAEGDAAADTWERAAPLWQSYLGLRRYWDRRVRP